MKTKTVELYVDLYPGWQDNQPCSLSAWTNPVSEVGSRWRRIKVIVDLPCFGGSAEATETVKAKTEVL